MANHVGNLLAELFPETENGGSSVAEGRHARSSHIEALLQVAASPTVVRSRTAPYAERMSERVPRPPRIPVEHEYGAGEEHMGQFVTNVSRNGAFIRTKKPLAIGATIDLNFTIVDDDLYTIEGVGEVVRMSADPVGVGVQFVSLTSDSKKVLERLLSKRTSWRPRR